MSRVRIVQLLCPARHCIVASAYESPDGAELPEYTAKLKAVYTRVAAEQSCGICGSAELSYEDRATIFATLAEARPVFEREERMQLAARAAIDCLKTRARRN